ncbi:MAG: molybdopterin-synthase adenylyltransferase MoeB [Bacteroidetes bacterium]|nr:MAG: molybdopterin-synthase adenylyltransferase MoeB [Bacteroidota bacterium]
MNKDFSAAERLRYGRHFSLSGVGISGQAKLRAARVLVVGAGGLGCPALLYLAAAGVGTIGIVDADRVSSSNLQRQILYGEGQLGQLKVEAARARLQELNPLVRIELFPTNLSRTNALDILADYDIVLDGTDNFPTRYLINDACVLADKVCVYGSVFRFEGQLSVFNALLPDGSRGPNYRDLYPSPPQAGQVPSCAQDGILGVLPGIIGTRQASEVLKLLLGIGDPLSGKLLLYDALSGQERLIRFPKRTNYRIDTLIDYELFCGLPAQESLPTIDATSLSRMLHQEEAIQLLDVRTASEFARGKIAAALLFPLAQLEQQAPPLNKEETVVVYCQSGKRSARAVALLQAYGFQRVFHLEGGISAYTAKEE